MVTSTMNLSRHALATDRWGLFRQLRQERRPHWSEEFGCWFLLDHESVAEAMRSPVYAVEHPLRSSRQIFGRTALDADGVDHRQLRRLVNWFTPRDLAAYRAIVDEETRAVLDEVDLSRPVPLISEVTERIPSRVMGRVLGISAEEGESLYAALGPVFAHLDDPRASLMDALDTADDVLERLLASTVDDVGIAARLLQGERQTQEWDREFLFRQVLLLLAAGTRTTALGMANCLAATAQPEALAAIGDGRVDEMIEESLRRRPPLHFTLRFLREDVVVQSVRMPAGAPVQLGMASANHDEEQFADPGEWRLGRPVRPTLTFGGGRHSCAGLALARVEIGALLEALVARMPHWTVEAGPETGVVFVGPSSLTMTGTPQP